MKRAVFISVFWAFAYPAAGQPDARMTDTEIGPVRAGMPIAELRALGHPYTTRSVNEEGDDYTEYSVRISASAEVIALDVDGRAIGVSTRSSSFSTDRGARVGATLEELQRLYPEGRLHIGVEEGHGFRFFSFRTRDREPSGIFYFDAERLPQSCFAPPRACPTAEAERAVEYGTVYENPMTSLRARAIGPVLLGMTEAEVAALGLPLRSEQGRTIVSVAEGREVTVTFRDGRAWELTTRSQGFVAYRGGRVGATLDQLRRYYPEGREGSDDRYMTFIIAPGHAFRFDPWGRTDACTQWNGRPCPEFGLTHAVEYSVTDER